MKLTKELEIAKRAAILAGESIMGNYNGNFRVEFKEDKSPLTEADKRANDIICELLIKNFPNYAILSEESKSDMSRLENDFCWIVDPLDGTKEFIKKNGEFTVNIALSYKHRVILGVIYVPVSEELYYATKNDGAHYEKNNETNKVQVSTNMEDLILVGSRSHPSEELKNLIEANSNRIKKSISAGSSLKGCLIARGDADIYYRFGLTSEWDTAAMQCIVEEAGGIFKQMDNTEMTYNRENSLNEKGFYIVNHIENIFNEL